MCPGLVQGPTYQISNPKRNVNKSFGHKLDSCRCAVSILEGLCRTMGRCEALHGGDATCAAVSSRGARGVRCMYQRMGTCIQQHGVCHINDVGQMYRGVEIISTSIIYSVSRITQPRHGCDSANLRPPCRSTGGCEAVYGGVVIYVRHTFATRETGGACIGAWVCVRKPCMLQVPPQKNIELGC